MKRHFLTFGAGKSWPSAARRLSQQAEATEVFSSVNVETGDEIFDRYPSFRVHEDFVRSNRRGWGYWLWKPFLIERYLERIPEGDLLFYLDAGCEIPRWNAGKLRALIDKALERKVMIPDFRELPIFNISFWSKQSWLDRAACDYPSRRRQIEVPKVSAGCIALVRCEPTLRLAREWLNACSAQEYQYVDDTPSSVPNRQVFFGNRHDQSVLSILVEHFGFECEPYAFRFVGLRDELYKWPCLLREPLLQCRNPTGNSFINWRLRLRSTWAAIVPYPARRIRGRIRADKLTDEYCQELVRLDLIPHEAEARS